MSGSPVALSLESPTTAARRSTGVPIPLRLAFEFASRISPGAAAMLAARLFLTPPRPRQARETRPPDFRVSSGGRRIAVWRNGRGPLVLLVHGWGGWGWQLGSFSGPLLEAGFTVATFDGPAHGRSEGRTTTIPDFAAALRAVAAELTGDERAFGLVAHSFGATVTSYAMSRGLRIDRTIFVAPPSDSRPYFDTFCDELAISPSVRTLALERLEARVGLPIERFGAARLLSGATRPLLVIHDRDDAEVPWIDGVRVSEAHRDARLITTTGLGHRRLLKDEAVSRHVVDFLTDDQISKGAIPC